MESSDSLWQLLKRDKPLGEEDYNYNYKKYFFNHSPLQMFFFNVVAELQLHHHRKALLSAVQNTPGWLTSLTFTSTTTFYFRQRQPYWTYVITNVPNERCIWVHRRHRGDHHTQPGCKRHSVDENLERRNHYLDLAGIENYTSRFGAGEWSRAMVELPAYCAPIFLASNVINLTLHLLLPGILLEMACISILMTKVHIHCLLLLGTNKKIIIIIIHYETFELSYLLKL